MEPVCFCGHTRDEHEDGDLDCGAVENGQACYCPQFDADEGD